MKSHIGGAKNEAAADDDDDVPELVGTFEDAGKKWAMRLNPWRMQTSWFVAETY